MMIHFISLFWTACSECGSEIMPNKQLQFAIGSGNLFLFLAGIQHIITLTVNLLAWLLCAYHTRTEYLFNSYASLIVSVLE